MTLKYCTKCVMPETRPRITFNEGGVCNACQWHEIKKNKIDWDERNKHLEIICDKYRRNDGYWDCIVPASGGKDSTYIADKLLQLDMHPLTISFAPQIPSGIDWRNWKNFVYTGFDNILITPDSRQYRKYAKDWLIEAGLPRQPFVTGISTSIIRIAKEKNIDLIMFAENGEVEYGGQNESLERFSRDFLINIYYEGQHNQEKYGPFWKVPSKQDLDKIYVTWMSFFEDWEPEDHAKVAVHKYGLEMPVGGNIGTFTNYAQIGDPGQDLHMYLCFLKNCFGRCSADVSIEIRRGRLSREEGFKIVGELDGIFPLEYLDLYLDYFEMEKNDFFEVLDSFANTEYLEQTGRKERPWMLIEK